MQYKDGKAPKKKENKNWIAIALSIFATSAIRVIIPPARKNDKSNKNINPTPEFLVFLPRLVVNSIFSLSKIRGLPTFTRITAEINIISAKITPTGCGTMYPSARLIKNSRKNKTLNKLSLLSLEAIKPVCGSGAFCNLITLLCASLKSSIRTYNNYWFKAYSFIIPNHIFKAIMQVMDVFNLYLQRMCKKVK